MNPLFVLDDSIFETMTREDAFETHCGLMDMGLAHLPADVVDVRFRIGAVPALRELKAWAHDPKQLTVTLGEDFYTITTPGMAGVDVEMLPEKDRVAIDTMVFDVLRYLVVSLATKNTEKKVVTRTPGKIARDGSLKHTHVTTLRVPKIQYLPGEGPSTGREVKPHFRRGHIRMQPFGEGRQERKRIWIEPLFVKADPEFIDAQKVYKVVA